MKLSYILRTYLLILSPYVFLFMLFSAPEILIKLLFILSGTLLLVAVPHILAFAGKMRVLWFLSSVSLHEPAARLYGWGYVVCMSLVILFSLGGFILIVDQTLSFF